MKNAIKKAISVLLVAVMVIGAAPLAGFVGLDLPELKFFSAKATDETISGDECEHPEDKLIWETIIAPSCALGTEVATCSLCGISGKSVVVCDESTYPESVHYSLEEMDSTWEFSYEGADKLVLNFSGLIRLGQGSAYIYLYDGNGDYMGAYTGNQLQNAEIEIEGSSFKMRFVKNDHPMYGFSFDSISAIIIDNTKPGFQREIPAVMEHNWLNQNGVCARANCGYECEHPEDKLTWNITAAPTCSPGTENATCNICGMGEKRLVVCDRSTYPESEHYYASNMDRTWEFRCDGAEKLILKFSSSTSTERVRDFIYIYDSNGKQKGKYSGTQLAEKEIELYGSSFKIRLTSDSVVESYGFRFASISAILPGYRTQELQREIPAVAEHDWSEKNGVCGNSCGYECPHQSYIEGICSVCGGSCETLGHNFDSNFGECKGCGYKCETMGHVFTLPDNVCSVCSIIGGTCGENVEWKFNADGELVISGIGAMRYFYYTEPVPWYSYRSSIKKVTVCKGVTEIGSYAFFDYPAIESVSLPDGIIKIGYASFGSCSSLKSIIIPDSVQEIDYDAFLDCTSLETVVFGKNLYRINNSAFMGCTKLKRIAIPEGVTYIGDEAFMNCTSLSEISLPDHVIEMTIDTFKNTGYSNSLSNWEGELLYIGKHLVNARRNVVANISIKEGTKTIPTALFMYGCVKSISIPDSVEYIGTLAFYGCDYLTSVKIGKGIKTIQRQTFMGCTALTDLTISDSVISIDDAAFKDCGNLTVVNMGSGVKTIGNRAFLGCDNIKSVNYNGTREQWNKIEIYSENPDWLNEGKINFLTEPGNTDDPSDNVLLKDCAVVKDPSKTVISYGDSIILHVDPSKIPEGGYVKWTPSNDNFSYSVSADGTTCTITPEKKGDTTFTAIIYDAEGNIVSADEQTMTSKAGFFDKIIAFFKKLFGATKVIPQAFKGIY